MTAQLVQLTQVSKAYRRGKENIQVLKELDFSIDEGEFIAIMGPSGSGKSTLLNLLAGLDQPTSGSIEINGDCITSFSQSQLTRWRGENIGFIFQFYNLLSTLNALKNVELPLLLRRLSAQQRKHRALTVLRLVELEDRAGHRPNELSGGQQQRVAIARALVSDPTLLVCDEPTGDLDRASADAILDLLRELNEHHGKTIVMVTHDPRAASCAGRQLHMDKGELLSADAQAGSAPDGEAHHRVIDNEKRSVA